MRRRQNKNSLIVSTPFLRNPFDMDKKWVKVNILISSYWKIKLLWTSDYVQCFTFFWFNRYFYVLNICEHGNGNIWISCINILKFKSFNQNIWNILKYQLQEKIIYTCVDDFHNTLQLNLSIESPLKIKQ